MLTVPNTAVVVACRRKLLIGDILSPLAGFLQGPEDGLCWKLAAKCLSELSRGAQDNSAVLRHYDWVSVYGMLCRGCSNLTQWSMRDEWRSFLVPT